MSQELSILLITVLAFGAVAIGVFVIGQFIAVQIRVHQRVAMQGRGAALRDETETAPGLTSGFDALVSTIFDEKRFGVEGSVFAGRGFEMNSGPVVGLLVGEIMVPQAEMGVKAMLAAGIALNDRLPNLDRLGCFAGVEPRVAGFDQLLGGAVLDDRAADWRSSSLFRLRFLSQTNRDHQQQKSQIGKQNSHSVQTFARAGARGRSGFADLPN